MSDKKISQLDASTTPLAGTEVLPVVQSGATKKVSVADLTAGRVTSVSRITATGGIGAPSANSQFGWNASQGAIIAGTGTSYDVLLQNKTNQSVLGIVTGTRDAEMTAGNLRFSAGKGIDFSADGQAAGMTSELLDDYEEGTWTPSFQSYDGVATVNSATYTKIGQLVTAFFNVTFDDTVDSSQISIATSSLPFVILSDSSISSQVTFSSVAGSTGAGSAQRAFSTSIVVANKSGGTINYTTMASGTLGMMFTYRA